jgi:LacI family transcriptional regulator
MKLLKNGQVTIKQVARDAGVSSQTVSRVINNRPDVSPETRQRIQQVIDKLGYQPNAIARSLIQRRSHTLGVVASGLEYYGPSHTLVGIEYGANQLGFSIFLNLLHQPEGDHVEQIVNGLLSRQVEGIIWAVPEIGNNRAWLQKAVPQFGIPVIFLSMQPNSSLNVVAVDNRSGGRMAAEHLLARGYRKLGLITGPLDWWEARERQLGWQEALIAAGVPFSADQVVEGDWYAASGERGLCQLLEKCPDIEAIFTSNDQMALGLLQAARRLGRKVPEELAVVGFDDIPESAYFCPPLTTVRQELYELGSTAVQAFAHMLEAQRNGNSVDTPQALLIQPQLVIRESSIASNAGKEYNPET